MAPTVQSTASSQLAGLSVAVFLGTLAIGVPLPVLPQYVHGALGYGTVMVGVAVGMQSAVTLVTRTYAGTISDTRGPKRAVFWGLVAGSLAGWAYLAAAMLSGSAALAALLVGRAVLGLGESLLITGAMALGVARVGGARAGMALVWVGVAMYAAYGLGAPLGDAAYRAYGFAPVAAAVILLPLLGLPLAAREANVPGLAKRPAPFRTVLRWVLPAGMSLALSAVGYSAIAAFLPLMLLARGWGGSGLVMTAFAGGFIVARLFFGGWPDRYGGRRVALASLAVECVGQVLLWRAPSVLVAAIGAALTGAGYSLTFPCLGIEAVRRVPAENRGVALGVYIMFLDLALGLGGPLLGSLVETAGYGAAYAAGAVACGLAIVTTWRLPPMTSEAEAVRVS